MLYVLQLLLLAMVLTTVTALFAGQGAIFALLLALSALSAYAFILWKKPVTCNAAERRIFCFCGIVLIRIGK